MRADKVAPPPGLRELSVLPVGLSEESSDLDIVGVRVEETLEAVARFPRIASREVSLGSLQSLHEGKDALADWSRARELREAP